MCASLGIESLLGKDEYGEFKDKDIESLDDDQILRLFRKRTASFGKS
jgi:hypothetical protein